MGQPKQVKPSAPPQEKNLILEDIMNELAQLQMEMHEFQVELQKSQAQFINEARTSLNNQLLKSEIWKSKWTKWQT